MSTQKKGGTAPKRKIIDATTEQIMALRRSGNFEIVEKNEDEGTTLYKDTQNQTYLRFTAPNPVKKISQPEFIELLGSGAIKRHQNENTFLSVEYLPQTPKDKAKGAKRKYIYFLTENEVIRKIVSFECVRIEPEMEFEDVVRLTELKDTPPAPVHNAKEFYEWRYNNDFQPKYNAILKGYEKNDSEATDEAKRAFSLNWCKTELQNIEIAIQYYSTPQPTAAEKLKKLWEHLPFQAIITEGKIEPEYSRLAIANELRVYKDLVEKNISAKQRAPKKNNDARLQWGGDVSGLFTKLKKGEFIADDTDEQNFKAIFENSSISATPIKWLKTNRLLAYLLHKLFDVRKWQKIVEDRNLFCNKKNKKLTANDLSAAMSNNTTYGAPKGYDEINKILSN